MQYYVFPIISWIFPILLLNRSSWRFVKWESVVFFGMNENVGEETGEKEEWTEGWWSCGGGVVVVWWWWCGGVVVWCGGVVVVVVCWGGGGVCVLECCATNFYQGTVHSPYSFCSSIPVNMAEEELAELVVGNDNGMYKAGSADDDAPRAVPSDARHDGWYGPEGWTNLALHIRQRTHFCA